MSPRQKALKLGEDQYSTGKPCINGHSAPRYTKHRHCTECWRLMLAKRYAERGDWERDRKRKEYERNPSISARHKVARLRAQPAWLDDDQRWTIEHMYEMARMFSRLHGEPYHVDHRVPLRGAKVCGLHAPWNLRVISGHDNLRKGNRMQEAA